MAATQVNVDYDSVQPFIVNCLHDTDVTKTTRLLAILWSFWFDGNKFCWQLMSLYRMSILLLKVTFRIGFDPPVLKTVLHFQWTRVLHTTFTASICGRTIDFL
ncbi:hypothetical protein PVK06_026147 [Gossypium arboreum]|uniref:Uncharacterized protein n=1 Tax=Gossypium arboreum TaxID=29729 RepID=A0ABR0NWX0_GOSAR|nr:hypothetical protein PVK06_026147 [Gossypium arboreum]